MPLGSHPLLCGLPPARCLFRFPFRTADSAGSKITPWESSACQPPCPSPTFVGCLKVTGQQLFLETSFLRIHSPEPPTDWMLAVLCSEDPGGGLFSNPGGWRWPSPLALYLPQEYCTWVGSGVKPSGEGAPRYRAPLGIHVSVSCNFSTVRSVLCNVPISPDSHRACRYPCKGSGGLDEAGPSRVSFLPGFLSLWGCRPSQAWWGAVCRVFVEMTVLERF